MSAIAKYKASIAARRSRERLASQRVQDSLIEVGGAVLGGIAAGRIELAPVALMGIAVDPGVIAAAGALAIDLSGLGDKGIAARSVSTTMLGFAAGRMALRNAAARMDAEAEEKDGV